MQSPVAVDISLNFNLAASGAGLKRTAHVLQMNRTGPGLDLNFSGSSLLKADLATSGSAKESAGDSHCIDGSTSSLGIGAGLNVFYGNRTGAGICAHFAANMAQLQIA